MSEVVEVYIKSISLSRDYGSALLARQHVACAPELLRQYGNLEGRFLDANSSELLRRLADISRHPDRTARLYDVGRAGGWLKAAIAGIRETPAVVVGGKKYLGLNAARDALATIATSGKGLGVDG